MTHMLRAAGQPVTSRAGGWELWSDSLIMCVDIKPLKEQDAHFKGT